MNVNIKIMFVYFYLLLFFSHELAATVIVRDSLNRISEMINEDGTGTNYLLDANGNRTIRERYDNRRTITVTINPPESGTVTGGGPTLLGTAKTLSATPADGFLFHHWSENGATIGTDPTLTFTVTNSRNLIAHFAPPAPEIVIEDQSTTPATDFVAGGSSLMVYSR